MTSTALENAAIGRHDATGYDNVGRGSVAKGKAGPNRYNYYTTKSLELNAAGCSPIPVKRLRGLGRTELSTVTLTHEAVRYFAWNELK